MCIKIRESVSHAKFCATFYDHDIFFEQYFLQVTATGLEPRTT